MAIEDRVYLVLNGQEIEKADGYDIEIGMLTQPSRFSFRIGHAGLVRDFLQKFPPRSPFELQIRSVSNAQQITQFTGFIDGRRADGPNSQVAFRGRDTLAPLHDSFAIADKNYGKGVTYLQLVEQVLREAGVDDPKISDATNADISKKTGSSVVPDSTKVRSAGVKKKTTKVTHHPPTIKAGEGHYPFLKRILDRAGLILLSASDGSFILTAPDPNKAPMYRLVNRRDRPRGGGATDGSITSSPFSRGGPSDLANKDRAFAPGTVITYDYDDDTIDRYTGIVVYGRSVGPNYDISKSRARAFDYDMLNLGFTKLRAYIDSNVSSPEEAEFYARRILSEKLRNGHFLSYTVAGHTTKQMGQNSRIVWSRDTTVLVEDHELGFGVDNVGSQSNGNGGAPHYIEHVSFWGDVNESHTVLRLMRPEDCLFFDEELV